jgi:hypothetical protein
MHSAKKIDAADGPVALKRTEPSCSSSPRRLAAGIGLAGVMVGLVMILSNRPLDMTALLALPFPRQPQDADGPVTSARAAKPDMRLTREGIELLLDQLDQAIRQRDVEGVLRHIAHDATITIHMKQGTQLQVATLTREEYRTTLQMGFAFPSAGDYTRVGTTVSVAPDGHSAKASFKSLETLKPGQHDMKIEGEETLVFKVMSDKPMIVSLEQVMPGDST